jgi:PAS domain S-box-containing protein
MRILLIEDNPGDIRLLQEYLKDGSAADGFQITQAGRLSTGLERLAEARFDAVLLDLSLPDSQGLDTLVRLHGAAKDVPIVVLTGIEDEALGVKLVQAGAQDYLVKGSVTGPLLMRSLRYAAERQRAEGALRESEERLRAIMDNSPAMVFLKDAEGRYLQANRTFVDTLRFRDSVDGAKMDLIGKTDEDIFSPEQAAAFRSNDQKVLEAGRPMEFEEVALRHDGPHTSIVVKFPLFNAHGQCYALCGIATDITERKRAEEELRHSQAFIMSMVENLPNMIFVKDAKDLKFVRFNKAGEHLLGYSREVLIGKSDYDFFPKDEADFFTVIDRQVLKTGSLLDIPEEPIETKHQGRRILHTRKIPIYDDTGEPQYLLGISEDITDRKRTEYALRKSEERYRSIFQNAVEGIFQTTLDGKYVAVNPALSRMYGYDSPEDMIATIMNIASQLYVDSGRRDEFIRLMHEQEELTGFEALVYRKDGSFIWISENVRAVRDPTGVLVGYEGTVEHITERKLAEQRLRDTLDQVRTLSGRLATVQEEERTRIARELHDELGVGLTCLKIDLSRLHTMVREETGARALKKVRSRIPSMIEQIDTTIASVQRLVKELRPAILDDLGLVAAIEWQCHDFQKRTDIPCTCATSSDDIAVEPERATALFRICQEALTNTARHAQATAVTVTLESWKNSLRLVVADNGVGIPDTKISNHQSLGLIGMRERVALFGGEITIQGHPEKGTTVTACLPRCLS